MRIQSKRVFIAGEFVPAILEFSEEKITNILPYGSTFADTDYGNMRIVPGFIDVHCHGAYEFDTNDATEEGLRLWASKLPLEGVTSFLPTTITQSKEVLTKALSNVANVMESDYTGAEILGAHLEGPFLNSAYKGAQPEAHILKPDVTTFKEFQKTAKGHIKIATIAAELDDDFALTKYLSETGVVPSIGHSAATFKDTENALANGAKSITHVYNCMPAFHHRENGLLGGAFGLPMYSEIIPDGQHSSFIAVYTFFMAKGPDYGLLISDSLSAKGLPKGAEFLFGGNLIKIHEDGTARLKDAGNLAGSTLRINEGLRNLVEKAGVPFHYAINACTKNPATMLGLDDRKGFIKENFDADLVVLDDDYAVVQTYCRGEEQL